MFYVKKKDGGEVYPCYRVRCSKGNIWFLVYDSKGWVWLDAQLTVPATASEYWRQSFRVPIDSGEAASPDEEPWDW